MNDDEKKEEEKKEEPLFSSLFLDIDLSLSFFSLSCTKNHREKNNHHKRNRGVTCMCIVMFKREAKKRRLRG